jgi:hypothetical protein
MSALPSVFDPLLKLGYEIGLAMPANDERPWDAYSLSGFGTTTHIAADDAATIASFADPALHIERVFQFENPDAATAREQLERRLGYTVTRADPKKNVFDVAGGEATLTGKSPADLVDLAANLPDVNPPPPPSPQDAVLGALAELDPATATVEDAIGAVQQALTTAGAKPAAPSTSG